MTPKNLFSNNGKLRVFIIILWLFFFSFFCLETFGASSLSPASGTLPNAQLSQFYTRTFVASTNNGWTCTQSTTWLNPTNGLTFVQSTGILSGIPQSAPATYNFSISIDCTNPSGQQHEIVTNNYTLNVVSPTAAELSIRGRVVEQNGHGISRARILLFNTNTGGLRYSTTNPLGYFRFSNLNAENFYIIQVNHKRFSFTELNFTLSEELNDLLIISNN